MYQIQLSPSARKHLDYFRNVEQKRVVTDIRQQLSHEPLIKTKNRKPLQDNPLSRWELRIGKFREFYDVIDNCVEIKAIGYKEHNTLFIAGKEFVL